MKIRFWEEISKVNIHLADIEVIISEPLNGWVIANPHLLITILAMDQKTQESNIWKVAHS